MSQISAPPPKAQTFTKFLNSGTWNKPTGCTSIRLSLTGGGGGGARSTKGGNSGATAVKWLDVTAITTATVTVGSGGTGATNSTGNSGGQTKWADGTNTIIANGGKNVPSTDATATGGDLNIRGGVADAGAAHGAPSQWGGGGWGSTAASNGHSGGAVGAGGGGTATGTGGNGTTGIVLVEEFYGS